MLIESTYYRYIGGVILRLKKYFKSHISGFTYANFPKIMKSVINTFKLLYKIYINSLF